MSLVEAEYKCDNGEILNNGFLLSCQKGHTSKVLCRYDIYEQLLNKTKPQHQPDGNENTEAEILTLRKEHCREHGDEREVRT